MTFRAESSTRPSPPACAIPSVTAILPVHDRAGSIARAIDSVLAQRWTGLELIVVDDGSTDGTRAIVEDYGDRLTLLTQPNRGAYAARNLALARASGDLIAFIDSDDAWLPGRLERQVPLMRDGVALVYGDVAIVDEPHDDAAPARATAFDGVRPQRGRVTAEFAWGNFIPTTTVLVRRDALVAIGGFLESPRISADYLAWFRLSQAHRFDYVDAPVARYTRHAAGISFDLGRSLAARIALFGAERALTDDPVVWAVIDRLLFNLGLHLALAVARGRAGSVDHPLRLARDALRHVPAWRMPGRLAAFVVHQLVCRCGPARSTGR